MKNFKNALFNVIFLLQALLLFLFLVENKIVIPPWLQVAGRLHPAVLHVPIGLMIFMILFLFLGNQFRKKAFHKVLMLVLMLISLSATVTALSGFFLAHPGDYDADSVSRHKMAGILLSFLCYFLLLSYKRFEKAVPAFYGIVTLTIGLLVFTGHTGGVLTHGENFVLAPVIAGSEEDSNNPSATVFQCAIYPVLEKKCISCHNRFKAKGKLIMTTVADFRKGGKHGAAWVAGKPEESRMIQNIYLPLSDDDHMPPDGKPQLSLLEIGLLKAWIKSGADFETTLSELKDGDSLKILASKVLSEKEAIRVEENFEFSPAPEDLIQKLNTPFRTVFPLYRNSPALQVDFFMKESFRNTSLQDLEEVKDQLVVLNLSKMPVTDDELKIIGTFTNLEKLNLNFSRINGQGIPSLQSLKKLNALSLAGTGVTAESIESILTLPDLKELFIWNTKVTEDERTALSRQYPGISITTSQFKDDRILRLGKPLLANEGMINKNELVVLKHSMPGVVIRYTLDTTDPDSLAGMEYKTPIHLGATSKIKAMACKPGWYCSDVFQITCFLEGHTPMHASLLSATDSYYRGEGAKSLTDGVKGFIEVLNAPQWLGFKDRPLEAGFDFGNDPPEIKSIVFSYARNLGSTYFPPMEVEVWGGKNPTGLTRIKKTRIPIPTNYDGSQVEALFIDLPSSRFSYYKVIARPNDKLPKWHSQKGKKGWLLVDEVIFN